MTRPTPPTRGEELLLARISAAAGREHLGRRRATYGVAAHPTPAHAAPVRGIRALLAFVRYGRSFAAKARADARLDLYEHGMTVAAKGRIHVVRYDTTSVFQKSTRHHPHVCGRVGTTRAYTLTDVDGKRIVLYVGPREGDGEDGGAADWWLEIRRAVTHAQLSLALAALDAGERLTFGDVWLTRREVGWGEVSARWPEVQQIEITHGAICLDVGGSGHRRHRTGPTVSEIPNLFVFCALVERLRTDGAHA
ncbi:DUF6585 family protein [Streptomyces chattanoogensis]|uniref:DUF6585 family protein n=1 Tax=Streptomyces chattanoogensis TaxID=66876 RepID=UPI0005D8C400|nr:hypothetical protein T261_1372 [Streptomyces lydicus]